MTRCSKGIFTDLVEIWCYKTDGVIRCGTMTQTAAEDCLSATQVFTDSDGNEVDPTTVETVPCPNVTYVANAPCSGPLEVTLTPEGPTGATCDDPKFVEVCNLANIENLLQQILDKPVVVPDTEMICNSQTGFWERHFILSINGVPNDPIITTTTTPCEDPAPIMQDPEISWVDNCVDGFIQRQLYQVQFIDSVAQEPVAIGDPIITTTACGQDIVSVDTEFNCNPGADVWDMVQVTTTNGVPAAPVVTPTTRTCDEDKPDFEQPRVCRDGTVYIITNQIDPDGTVTELSAINTGEVCAPPVKQEVEVPTCDATETTTVDSEVSIKGVVPTKECPKDIEIKDVEYVCNKATGFLDKIVHTWINGLAQADVVTATTYKCDKFKDIEYREQCNPLTNKIDIVAVGFDENDIETELSVTAGTIECPAKPKPDCVESQEWTYAGDNTGTNFADTATYVMTLSDGSTLSVVQTPTGGWTQQNQLLTTLWQAEADAAGLAWFIEPRAVNNAIPTDISGGYGANSVPTGLPGAPSVPVAEYLIKNGIVARYLNFQICPGQPVPVSITRTESSMGLTTPFELTTAGAIKGPLQRFFVCRECGEEPVWFLDDGITPAQAGQIPNCYEPCGVISQLPAPPENDCKFEIDVNCDSNGSDILTDFTNTITRRATICNGNTIAVDYFQADPNDPSALQPYSLVGDFVDCATGLPVPLPELPCTDFVTETLYQMVGDTELDGELRNREWHDTQPASALISDPIVATQIGRDFYANHDFTLTPDTDSTVTSLVLNDTNNTATELDIQTIDGIVEVKQGGWFRYSGSSEGYWAVYLAQCCKGELVRIADSGGFSPTRVMEFYLPKGTHQFRLVNIDSGGSNSSATFGYSLDSGITYINDNTPPKDVITFGSNKLEEKCISVKICKDSGEAFDLLTGDPVDLSTTYPCSRLTCSETTNQVSDSGSTEVFDGNVTDVSPNPDQTHVIVSGTGSVPAGLKSVTINNISGTTIVAGGFELGNGRRVDSITYNATEVDRARGLLPAIAIVGGVWQWTGIQPIAEV